ncbi:MAG: hypothetical protein QOG01_3109 [Pseudonocardiales bacterium]|jgi:hypothetical protein|nr:hypothetical protein [Pseudonocardiales bacterium]
MTESTSLIAAASARDQITDLVYGYAELMDAGDFAGIGRLLGHGSISVEGSDDVVMGAEAIEEKYTRWSTRYPDTGTPKTKHVITNVIVGFGADDRTALVRAYFTVLQAVAGLLPLQPILAGRYRLSFESVDDVWRFTNLHVLWDLSGDLSAHINAGVE